MRLYGVKILFGWLEWEKTDIKENTLLHFGGEVSHSHQGSGLLLESQTGIRHSPHLPRIYRSELWTRSLDKYVLKHS